MRWSLLDLCPTWTICCRIPNLCCDTSSGTSVQMSWMVLGLSALLDPYYYLVICNGQIYSALVIKCNFLLWISIRLLFPVLYLQMSSFSLSRFERINPMRWTVHLELGSLCLSTFSQVCRLCYFLFGFGINNDHNSGKYALFIGGFHKTLH